MPRATSLRDLLEIRHANREYIESLNENLGSALGFKRRTGEGVSDEPAVLIFVPRKIDPRWLPDDQRIVSELRGPRGLTCAVDVVEGGKLEDTQVWVHDEWSAEDYTVGFGDLRGPAALSDAQLRLREVLRGWTDKVMPGAQLAGFDDEGNSYHGTLGCFCRHADGRLGFLTNHHVSGGRGSTMYFPETHARPIGITSHWFETIADERHYGGIVDEAGARVVLDCAFVELSAEIADEELEARLPTLGANGEIRYRRLGEPLELDLDTMGPIGTEVVGVGRTRSYQRGTIAAYAYEYDDRRARSTYTDYLIIGEEGDEFSDPGDSGKLIVTRDGLRPVALLWGGWREQLRSGRAQENWTYAIEIGAVTRRLDVEIVSRLP